MQKITTLLILPGLSENTKEVTLEVVGSGVNREPVFESALEVMGVEGVEEWPRQWVIKKVYYDKDHQYTYKLFVGDDSFLNGSVVNLCATITADPLGECKARYVYGPCLLLSTAKEGNLTKDDWNKICAALWDDEDLVVINANQEFPGEKHDKKEDEKED